LLIVCYFIVDVGNIHCIDFGRITNVEGKYKTEKYKEYEANKNHLFHSKSNNIDNIFLFHTRLINIDIINHKEEQQIGIITTEYDYKANDNDLVPLFVSSKTNGIEENIDRIQQETIKNKCILSPSK